MFDRLIFGTVALFTVMVYGPMATMSISAVAVMLLATIVVVREPKVLAKLQTARKLFYVSLALAVACVWSLVWAKWTDLEFMGAHPNVQILKDSAKAWHLFFPFFLLVLLSRLSDRKFRTIIVIWLFAGLLISFFAFAQHYFPIYKPSKLAYLNYPNYVRGTGFWDRLSGSYHATGFTGFHLSFASIMAFPFGVWLTLAVLSLRRGRHNVWSLGAFSVPLKPLAVFGAVVTFGANFLSYSKIAWISGPLTVALIGWTGLRGRIRYGVMGVLIMFAGLWSTTSEFRLRFQGLNSILGERLELWKANWAMVREHPWFGVGWHHNFELSYAYYDWMKVKHGFSSHAHNNLLDQWATTGLFGVLSFIVLNFLLFKMSLKVYRAKISSRGDDLLPRALGLGFFAAWICLHINGVTQANFWDAKVLHQIGWVSAVTLEIVRRAESRVRV